MAATSNWDALSLGLVAAMSLPKIRSMSSIDGLNPIALGLRLIDIAGHAGTGGYGGLTEAFCALAEDHLSIPLDIPSFRRGYAVPATTDVSEAPAALRNP